MLRTGPNEHLVRTMESKPVHTHSFIRVLRSRRILLQIWYVTFQIMKFLGLSIGLQTFAVVFET